MAGTRPEQITGHIEGGVNKFASESEDLFQKGLEGVTSRAGELDKKAAAISKALGLESIKEEISEKIKDIWEFLKVHIAKGVEFMTQKYQRSDTLGKILIGGAGVLALSQAPKIIKALKALIEGGFNTLKSLLSGTTEILGLLKNKTVLTLLAVLGGTTGAVFAAKLGKLDELKGKLQATLDPSAAVKKGKAVLGKAKKVVSGGVGGALASLKGDVEKDKKSQKEIDPENPPEGKVYVKEHIDIVMTEVADETAVLRNVLVDNSWITGSIILKAGVPIAALKASALSADSMLGLAKVASHTAGSHPMAATLGATALLSAIAQGKLTLPKDLKFAPKDRAELPKYYRQIFRTEQAKQWLTENGLALIPEDQLQIVSNHLAHPELLATELEKFQDTLPKVVIDYLGFNDQERINAENERGLRQFKSQARKYLIGDPEDNHDDKDMLIEFLDEKAGTELTPADHKRIEYLVGRYNISNKDQHKLVLFEEDGVIVYKLLHPKTRELLHGFEGGLMIDPSLPTEKQYEKSREFNVYRSFWLELPNVLVGARVRDMAEIVHDTMTSLNKGEGMLVTYCDKVWYQGAKTVLLGPAALVWSMIPGNEYTATDALYQYGQGILPVTFIAAHKHAAKLLANPSLKGLGALPFKSLASGLKYPWTVAKGAYYTGKHGQIGKFLKTGDVSALFELPREKVSNNFRKFINELSVIKSSWTFRDDKVIGWQKDLVSLREAKTRIIEAQMKVRGSSKTLKEDLRKLLNDSYIAGIEDDHAKIREKLDTDIKNLEFQIKNHLSEKLNLALSKEHLTDAIKESKRTKYHLGKSIDYLKKHPDLLKQVYGHVVDPQLKDAEFKKLLKKRIKAGLNPAEIQQCKSNLTDIEKAMSETGRPESREKIRARVDASIAEAKSIRDELITDVERKQTLETEKSRIINDVHEFATASDQKITDPDIKAEIQKRTAPIDAELKDLKKSVKAKVKKIAKILPHIPPTERATHDLDVKKMGDVKGKVGKKMLLNKLTPRPKSILALAAVFGFALWASSGNEENKVEFGELFDYDEEEKNQTPSPAIDTEPKAKKKTLNQVRNKVKEQLKDFPELEHIKQLQLGLSQYNLSNFYSAISTPEKISHLESSAISQKYLVDETIQEYRNILSIVIPRFEAAQKLMNQLYEKIPEIKHEDYQSLFEINPTLPIRYVWDAETNQAALNYVTPEELEEKLFAAIDGAISVKNDPNKYIRIGKEVGVNYVPVAGTFRDFKRAGSDFLRGNPKGFIKNIGWGCFSIFSDGLTAGLLGGVVKGGVKSVKTTRVAAVGRYLEVIGEKLPHLKGLDALTPTTKLGAVAQTGAVVGIGTIPTLAIMYERQYSQFSSRRDKSEQIKSVPSHDYEMPKDQEIMLKKDITKTIADLKIKAHWNQLTWKVINPHKIEITRQNSGEKLTVQRNPDNSQYTQQNGERGKWFIPEIDKAYGTLPQAVAVANLCNYMGEEFSKKKNPQNPFADKKLAKSDTPFFIEQHQDGLDSLSYAYAGAMIVRVLRGTYSKDARRFYVEKLGLSTEWLKNALNSWYAKVYRERYN